MKGGWSFNDQHATGRFAVDRKGLEERDDTRRSLYASIRVPCTSCNKFRSTNGSHDNMHDKLNHTRVKSLSLVPLLISTFTRYLEARYPNIIYCHLNPHHRSSTSYSLMNVVILSCESRYYSSGCPFLSPLALISSAIRIRFVRRAKRSPEVRVTGTGWVNPLAVRDFTCICVGWNNYKCFPYSNAEYRLNFTSVLVRLFNVRSQIIVAAQIILMKKKRGKKNSL